MAPVLRKTELWVLPMLSAPDLTDLSDTGHPSLASSHPPYSPIPLVGKSPLLLGCLYPYPSITPVVYDLFPTSDCDFGGLVPPSPEGHELLLHPEKGNNMLPHTMPAHYAPKGVGLNSC